MQMGSRGARSSKVFMLRDGRVAEEPWKRKYGPIEGIERTCVGAPTKLLLEACSTVPISVPRHTPTALVANR